MRVLTALAVIGLTGCGGNAVTPPGPYTVGPIGVENAVGDFAGSSGNEIVFQGAALTDADREVDIGRTAVGDAFFGATPSTSGKLFYVGGFAPSGSGIVATIVGGSQPNDGYIQTLQTVQSGDPATIARTGTASLSGKYLGFAHQVGTTDPELREFVAGNATLAVDLGTGTFTGGITDRLGYDTAGALNGAFSSNLNFDDGQIGDDGALSATVSGGISAGLGNLVASQSGSMNGAIYLSRDEKVGSVGYLQTEAAYEIGIGNGVTVRYSRIEVGSFYAE